MKVAVIGAGGQSHIPPAFWRSAGDNGESADILGIGLPQQTHQSIEP